MHECIKAWNKSISIRTDRRKRLAACVPRIILVGCMNAHQFDARGRQESKPKSDFFFAPKAKASTVVGKGEECVPCDPGYELRKEESLTRSCEENTRGWDRIKTPAACMNVFPAPFGAYIDRLGAVPSNYNNPQQCQHQAPGRIKNVHFGQKQIITPVHHNNSSEPESLKAALNEWWHSPRTTCPAAASYRIIESIEWRHFNKTLRVSVTLVETISLYNNKESQWQHEMPDYVKSNNISGTSQIL